MKERARVMNHRQPGCLAPNEKDVPIELTRACIHEVAKVLPVNEIGLMRSKAFVRNEPQRARGWRPSGEHRIEQFQLLVVAESDVAASLWIATQRIVKKDFVELDTLIDCRVED